MIRPSLEEAISEKPRSIEHLERVRKLELDKIARMNRSELEEMMLWLENKLFEERAMLRLLRENRARYPELITPEKITYKERSIMMFESLREAVKRRLGK